MKTKYLYNLSSLCLVLFFVIFSGCKKLIEVDPPANSLVSGNVYASDATAAAFVSGIYTTFGQSDAMLVGAYTGLSSDELSILGTQESLDLINYYKNTLSSLPSPGYNCWEPIYPLIYRCNVAQEGISSSSSLTPKVKQQLLGETKFMRALFYFYLSNLYGGVPLVLTADYKTNSNISRSSVQDVRSQILKDLTDAQSLLSKDYLEADAQISKSTTMRVRPTYWAATALLARVQLYSGDYIAAESTASKVIENTVLFNLPALNSVFLNTSKEAIFQIQPTQSLFRNTIEGSFLVLPSTGPTTNFLTPAFISESLINSFTEGDGRKSNWMNSVVTGTKTYYYPNKYKLGDNSTPGSEYSMILRLGEQFLIRSEARILQGGAKIAEGIADLNMLRNRARSTATSAVPNPLPALPLNLPQDQAIVALAKERRNELFVEGGHRWFDLKRTGKLNEVMAVECISKNSVWESYQSLWPIPNSEIKQNPGLKGQQNPGYQ